MSYLDALRRAHPAADLVGKMVEIRGDGADALRPGWYRVTGTFYIDEGDLKGQPCLSLLDENGETVHVSMGDLVH